MFEWLEWLNNVMQIAVDIAVSIGLLFLCKSILTPRFRKQNLSFGLTAGLYLLYRLILWLLPATPPQSVSVFIFLVATLGLYFGILKLCFTDNAGLLAYVALTQVAVFRLCRFFVIGLANIFSTNTINALNYIQDEHKAQVGLTFILVIQSLILSLGVAIPFLWITRRIGRGFPKTPKPLTRQEISVLLLPNAAAIALCIVLQLITMIYDRDTARYEVIFDKEPLTMLAIPFAALVLMVLLISNLRVFSRLLESNDQRRQKLIMASQIDGLQQHLRTVEQLYSGIRGLKHDMNNHLQNIAGLVQTGQYDQVEQYLKSAEATLQTLNFTYHTCNPVTDVIINQYVDQTDKPNLKFECYFTYPKALQIDAFEIGIIIDNALSNAFRAALSFVKLRGYTKGSLFFIECSNDYDGRIAFDPRTGLPCTTKENSGEHGLGLRNIQGCADKYSGTLDIQTADNIFLLTVMLKSPKK